MALTIRILKPTRLIIVFDGANGSKRRKKIYPQYKSGRGKGLRLNRAYNWSTAEEEQKNMILQLKRTISYLKKLPITIITIDNIEADDVIGYLAREMCNEEVYISSSDKDFYQLITEKVKVWNPISKTVIDINTAREKFGGIHPKNILLFRSIDGDKSDNVKGIKGFGIKTTTKYFPMLLGNNECTIDQLVEHSKRNIENGKKYKDLLDNVPMVELNYKICQLAESNISTSAKFKIMDHYRTKPIRTDLITIKKMYIRDKIWTSIKDINSWLNENFSYLNSFAKTKL